LQKAQETWNLELQKWTEIGAESIDCFVE
jgi:hypothetical protein